MLDKKHKKDNTPNIKTILGYYWRGGKRYPFLFIVAFTGLALAGLISHAILPLFYKALIDTLSAGLPETFEPVVLILTGLFGLIILQQILYRAGQYSQAHLAVKVRRDLELLAFRNLMKHSYAFFSNQFTGSLVSRAGRFVSAFERLLPQMTWHIVIPLINFVVILFVMFREAPLLGYIFTGWAIVLTVIGIILTRLRMKYDLFESEMQSKVTARISDVITNILNLKMFATLKAEEKAFEEVTNNHRKANMASYRFENLVALVMTSAFSVVEVAGIATAVYLWSKGLTTVGTIVLVQAYVSSIFHLLWSMLEGIGQIIRRTADASEMVEILETPIGVVDALNPIEFKPTQGAIEFKDVNFGYGEERVLKNFSLSIKPGEKIALVGHSGVGKTTITKLLLRFVDISSGAIEIDGQNIAQIRQDDLREAIAFVPQEPLLFHRTLKENIVYAREDATDEEVIAVAKKAHAHDFIMQTPEQYDTLVGERGIKLSGGERQRVAIARAMLKKAPILVLDEATSALDSVSERYIQDAFNTLMEGKTTIVIAHRLSTVQKMDRIIVLDENGIAEEGTHSELIKNKGLYATFWNEQTSGFIE